MNRGADLNGERRSRQSSGFLQETATNIGKVLVFLTNKFNLPAIAICALYKARWQVELFFKWVKQFFGPSGNSVKSHIGIAVSV